MNVIVLNHSVSRYVLLVDFESDRHSTDEANQLLALLYSHATVPVWQPARGLQGPVTTTALSHRGSSHNISCRGLKGLVSLLQRGLQNPVTATTLWHIKFYRLQFQTRLKTPACIMSKGSFYRVTQVANRINCLPVTYFFGGHVDVNSYTYKQLICVLTWNNPPSHSHTRHSFTPIFNAQLKIFMICEDLFCSVIFNPSTTCPVIFLPVHNRFYPSKWRVSA